MKVWTKHDLIRVMILEFPKEMDYIAIDHYGKMKESEFVALLRSKIPGTVNELGGKRYYIS